MSADALAELDRAAAELPVELQIIWMRIRGSIVGPGSPHPILGVRLTKPLAPTGRVWMDLYHPATNERGGRPGRCTSADPAWLAVQQITEWFRERLGPAHSGKP